MCSSSADFNCLIEDEEGEKTKNLPVNFVYRILLPLLKIAKNSTVAKKFHLGAFGEFLYAAKITKDHRDIL